MINIKQALKATSAWISIIYIICFTGVAIFPASRIFFMKYALHADVAFGQSYINIGSFVSGLIVWNVIMLIAAWLFVFLFNKIKQ